MTQRAFLVGFIGLCIYIIVLFNDLPAFSILTWLSISILVSSGGVALLSLQGLRCHWRVGKSVAIEAAASSPRVMQERATAEADTTTGDEALGDEASIEVELGNFGTLNKAGLLLDVALRQANGESLTRRFLIEALPANSTIAFPLPLRGLKRGRYRVEELRIVGSDVLGLFRATLRIKQPGNRPKPVWWNKLQRQNPSGDHRLALSRAAKRLAVRVTIFVLSLGAYAVGVWGIVLLFKFLHSRQGAQSGIEGAVLLLMALVVLRWLQRRGKAASAIVEERAVETERRILVGPATVTGQSGGLRSFREGSGGDSSGRSPERGEEIRGTRPYVAGDDLRTVHWKSTARLGRLVVKEFQPDVQSQNLVIWDGAAFKNETEPATASNRSRRLNRTSRGNRPAPEAANREVEGALENGLRFTASLCRALDESGQACTLWRLDSSPRRAASSEFAHGSRPGRSTSGDIASRGISINASSGGDSRMTTNSDVAQSGMADKKGNGANAGDANAGNGSPNGAATMESSAVGAVSSAPFAVRCAEILADARVGGASTLSQALSTHVRDMARGGTAYLVTQALSPDVRAAVAMLQRQGLHVTVALTMEPNTQASPLLSTPTTSRTAIDVQREVDGQGAEATEASLAGARVIALGRARGEKSSATRSSATEFKQSLDVVRRALNETLGGKGESGQVDLFNTINNVINSEATEAA